MTTRLKIIFCLFISTMPTAALGNHPIKIPQEKEKPRIEAEVQQLREENRKMIEALHDLGKEISILRLQLRASIIDLRIDNLTSTARFIADERDKITDRIDELKTDLEAAENNEERSSLEEQKQTYLMELALMVSDEERTVKRIEELKAELQQIYKELNGLKNNSRQSTKQTFQTQPK